MHVYAFELRCSRHKITEWQRHNWHRLAVRALELGCAQYGDDVKLAARKI